MVDNIVPISNFHPYQPPLDTPHSEEPEHGLPGVLEKVGVEPARFRNFRDRVRSMSGHDWLTQLRTFARSRPAMILSGIAVALTGARLIHRRMIAD